MPRITKKNSPGHPPKIVLAIDDDQNYLDAVSAILSAEGYDVLPATSGANALRLLRRSLAQIRVVLLDYRMLPLNGEEMLHCIRSLNPQIKIIAITGLQDQLLPPAYRESADRLLHKPYRMKDLIDSVHSLVA